MAATKRVITNDGQLSDPDDLNEVMANVDLLLQELLKRTHGDTDFAATALATVAGATDQASAAVPSYGFFGPSLRVYRVDATHIKLVPGLGLQHDPDVADGWPVLVIRLGADAVEVTDGIALASLPSAGNYRRALVLTSPRDVTISRSVEVLDTAGNRSTSSLPSRTFPEVGAPTGVTSNIVVRYGDPASSAAAAARPTGLPGHVQLAELLLDSTGLANAANRDGNTPGITDLRPRVRPSKAGGAYDSRRATCSMDETTGARNARRMGAKRAGVHEVDGWVQIPTGSRAEVVLDTSIDWRDAMVRVEFNALCATSNVPGGSTDNVYMRNTHTSASSVSTANQISTGVAHWYSGTGGTSDPFYTSADVQTAADHTDTRLRFYARASDGALCCNGIAGDASRELYFLAAARGPLGKRPATGVES